MNRIGGGVVVGMILVQTKKNGIIYNDFNSICTVLNTVALSVLWECGNLSLSHLLMCYNCSISLWKSTFEHFENEFPPVLRNIYIKAALLFFLMYIFISFCPQ